MDQHNLHHINKEKVCDLCNLHDPLTKNYSEDFELQTALQNYMQKTTGEKISIADITKLCESCYDKVRDGEESEDDE